MNNKPNNPVQPPLGAVDPSILVGLAGANNPLINEYLEMLVGQMREVQQTKAQKLQQFKNRQKQFAIQKEQEQKEIRGKQSQCSHKTIDGRMSQIGGQRLPGGDFVLRCQVCQKKYTKKNISELPMELRPPADYMGGPNY